MNTNERVWVEPSCRTAMAVHGKRQASCLDRDVSRDARFLRFSSVAVLMALLLTCLGAHSQGKSALPSIRVGAVSSISGPFPFGHSVDAASAFFAKVNALGGVNGRSIELMVMDDASDPERAQKAARQFIEDQRIVGLVGGASAVDCAVNTAAYERAGLMALLGVGIEAACFDSSHVIPLNTGPFRTLKNALHFAWSVLRSQRICAVLPEIANLRSGMKRAADEWQQVNQRLTHVMRYGFTSDAQEMVRQAIVERCDAVIHAGMEPMVIDWIKAVQSNPDAVKLATVFLTPAYTARVASELGSPAAPVYCMTEFEPWSSRSPAIVDWRETMRLAKVPRSSFSQGGYSSAQLFVRILSGMNGEVTRQTFAAAARAVHEMNLPMLGNAFTVGDLRAHNPNRSNMVMKLEAGSWRIATPFWMEAP